MTNRAPGLRELVERLPLPGRLLAKWPAGETRELVIHIDALFGRIRQRDPVMQPLIHQLEPAVAGNHEMSEVIHLMGLDAHESRQTLEHTQRPQHMDIRVLDVALDVVNIVAPLDDLLETDRVDFDLLGTRPLTRPRPLVHRAPEVLIQIHIEGYLLARTIRDRPLDQTQTPIRDRIREPLLRGSHEPRVCLDGDDIEPLLQIEVRVHTVVHADIDDRPLGHRGAPP